MHSLVWQRCHLTTTPAAMHATLIHPGQPAQPLTPEQLTALAPRLFDSRPAGGTLPPRLTAYTTVAAELMGAITELVDVFSSSETHLIFALFDHTTGRNKEAEQQCARLLPDDFFGDRKPDGSDDEGHLFGPFLFIETAPTAEQIAAAAERAETAFWAEVAASFPHIKTGDFDPGAALHLQTVMANAVTEWLAANTPPE